MVGSNNGSFALLECFVEAFPPALTYWVFGESKMIENNWKYKMQQEDVGPYTTHLKLNITYVEPADYALYKCVAKNERGKTFGLFTLYGKLVLANNTSQRFFDSFDFGISCKAHMYRHSV